HRILSTAKSLFYPERSYPHIFDLLGDSAELEAFRLWLPNGRVDQKRQDALLMLRTMPEFLASTAERKRTSYHFELTNHWENFQRFADSSKRSGHDALVLEQLRRDPVLLARSTEGALSWCLAVRGAWRQRMQVDAAAIMRQSAELCGAHGLTTPEEV